MKQVYEILIWYRSHGVEKAAGRETIRTHTTVFPALTLHVCFAPICVWIIKQPLFQLVMDGFIPRVRTKIE